MPYFPVSDGFIGDVNNVTLEIGQRIDRYGGTNYSQFFAPIGTPREMRALPPESMLGTLRSFEVNKPINAFYGLTAPAFDQIGLGYQLKTELNLGEQLKGEYLTEVMP